MHHLQTKIHEIRGQKVLLDFDLAELYEIETRVLNQAVKRNIKRFPNDFMFQLTEIEWLTMSSQIVTTSSSKRPKKAYPYAFTEQGVAMLSGILNSNIAINVNIAIMRTFVYIRRQVVTNTEFNKKLEELESKYDQQFGEVFEALHYLIQKEKTEELHQKRKQIGFKK
jgi:ORF6N domain